MSTLSLTEDEVVRITQEIWGSMLNLDLATVESGWSEGETGVVGCVQIVGAWEGSVRLDLSPALARKAAAAFTGLEETELVPEQARDAVGELTNITAGSIKALLPAPSHLSLPVTADGTDYTIKITGGRNLLQSAFSHGGERLFVTILERAEPSGIAGLTSIQ